MRATYITATVIAAAILIWLASGQLGQPETERTATLAEQRNLDQARLEDRVVTPVRARVSKASPVARMVKLRGKTENKRTVSVRAETSGTLVGRPVDRGVQVSKGDLLCRLSVEDRQAGLDEAREAVNQARIEYEGSIKLKERGFQSETAIAQSKARLASARAQLTRRELDLERTFVRAPFDGFVEDVHMEIGDFVQPGSECVTLVDLDPMLLVGRVPESEVGRVKTGITAAGVLTSGQRVSGTITFVGQQSDPATRTYDVEIEVPNPDFALRSGITTDILVPVEEVMAHKISPALFALNDAGTVGVRTLTDDNVVEFSPIQVVSEDNNGVWISGLPASATLITVGQELVVPGERVEVTFEAAPELSASSSAADAAKPENANPRARGAMALAAINAAGR